MSGNEEYEYSPADAASSEKLKRLYASTRWCEHADLYRDDDGIIFVLCQWMTNHGIGPDHSSQVVNSLEELRGYLNGAADLQRMERKDVERLCSECAAFFEKQ